MRDGFVVAYRLALLLPEATEKPLNRVAPGVAGRVINLLPAVSALWFRPGADTAGSQPVHERVEIVAMVNYDIGQG